MIRAWGQHRKENVWVEKAEWGVMSHSYEWSTCEWNATGVGVARAWAGLGRGAASTLRRGFIVGVRIKGNDRTHRGGD